MFSRLFRPSATFTFAIMVAAAAPPATAQQTTARRQRRRELCGFKLACWALLCSGLTPVSSFAQQVNAADGKTRLEEIVVTAQRRSEKLQNVPVAVAAFSAKALRAGGVATIQDLAQVVPSLSVSASAGVFQPFIRGVGNGAATLAGNESSVATYIDDVYYARLSTAYLALGDVDRVEVLSGPQGTLFGRNSSGGAIQMFTKDPSQKTELNATIGYASYDTPSGQIYLSTPITDNLTWNIAAGGSDQRQGWGHSLVTGQAANLGASATIRSKLIWEPTAGTRVKLVAFYAYSNSDIGSAQDFYGGTYGSTPAVPFPGYPSPPVVLASLKDNPATFYDTRLNSRPRFIERGYGGSIRIDQSLDFADLVSISAFRNSRGTYHIDLNYSAQPFFSSDLNDTENQVTQEFQIKSKPASRISWIVGAYYLHSKAGYDPVHLYGDLLNFSVTPGTTESVYGVQTINSYASYAQATAPIGDRTNLTLGARYTIDNISAVGAQDLLIPHFGMVSAAPPGLPNPYATSANFGAFTYKAAIDHHFTDELMAYASVARGYKSGAFNTLPLETAAARPEIVKAYEVGVKTEILDRRIRLNGALFWNDIKNPQVLTTVTSGIIAAISLTNAQAARSRGAEIGFDAVAAEGLKLRGGVTYDDSEYTQFSNAPYFSGGMVPGSVITGPVLRDGSGNQLASVPKWRCDVGANYSLNTSIGDWVGDVGLAYTSKFPWTADNRLLQKAVTLVNASLSFTPSSMSRTTFSLWGKNLGDAKYYSLGQEETGPARTGGYTASLAAPLTVGGTISVKY